MTTPQIPLDPNDWTVDDWRELYNGIEEIKQRIAARYEPRHTPKQTPPLDNAHVEPGCEQFQ
jgi:hypothetical protein